MKFFLHIFVIFISFYSVVLADNFKFVKHLTLKKDIQKKILVKYDDKKKLFKFSWTLYKNGGLVIFRSYDRFVAQNILYLNGINQSFKVELKPSGANYSVPYLLVKFIKFNFKKSEASFDIFLSDDKRLLTLKYLKK